MCRRGLDTGLAVCVDVEGDCLGWDLQVSAQDLAQRGATSYKPPTICNEPQLGCATQFGFREDLTVSIRQRRGQPNAPKVQVARIN